MNDNDNARARFRAELEALEAALANLVGRRYRRKFNEMPPVMYWHQDSEGLYALMEQAIKDGRPLTADDLLKAQGMDPLPPEASPHI